MQASTNGAVLIGSDTRVSSDLIKMSIASGIISEGVEAHDAGVLPTPVLAHITRKLSYSLGIMLSASHNPADYNGVKLISPSGLKIADTLEKRIEKYLLSSIPNHRVPDGVNLPRCLKMEHLGFLYVDDIIAKWYPKLKNCKLKIAVDCANGATSFVAREIFNKLGLKATLFNNKPDGKNINDDCGAMYPKRLASIVVSNGASLGVAFDGDGDRVIFIDELGNIRDGDYVLAMSALDKKKDGTLMNNTVVGTIMTNLGLEQLLNKNGIRLVRTPVGDRFVTDELMKGGYSVGGEQSGHIIYRDQSMTGDGIITLLEVLDILSRSTSGSLHKESKCLNKLPQSITNVRVSAKPPLKKLKRLTKTISELTKKMGTDYRINVRYSGTEPLLRIMVEGKEQEIIDKISFAIRKSAELDLT
jgi:phosphoglucosamine mutase